MDFVTDKKAIEYLKSFPKKKKYKSLIIKFRVDLTEIFPGAIRDAIDFLQRAL